ncbi:TIGR01777 family oxidoreductase [Carboxylicivirga caseinilyticus]|uniref:TIGR01777 family oxidoreductase n=1 Tax=Carboxylicivirga caseinilyticus TaxID=3417572 RepID=UPI003D331722|nr:TIGR01777 family oxidoreductase [Marinilabiliaceae bacterium A049]
MKVKDKIAISGATGFIGKELVSFLEKNGYEVVKLSRELLHEPSELTKAINGSDAVINLAGHSIAGRWNEKVKKKILYSRLNVTRRIVDAIEAAVDKPNVVISASAVGIYDTFEVHDEFSTNYANDFLGEVCQKWEEEALRLGHSKDVRLCLVRLGAVLGKSGGAFPKLVKPFKFGLGASMGDGHQVFPIIHIQDVLSSIWYLLKREASGGIYNLVAPEMISNLEFSVALAEKLKRPLWLKLPEFLLKLLLGEGAVILLEGQKVIPKRMLKDDFHFSFPTLESMLDDLC